MASIKEVTDKSPIQERLLDALERCFSRFGIQKTTLADVAAEAGVSRMTVYRHFEDRQALFDSAVIRNIGRQWEVITCKLQRMDTLDEWLLESLLLFHQQYIDDETVELYRLRGGFTEGLEVALTEPGLRSVTVHFESLFSRAVSEGRIEEGLTVEDIAEWIHRTNHTLIAHPSPRLTNEKDLRRWLGAQITGGLVRPPR